MQALFLASGFAALGNEIIWARYLALLMYDTVYTYTLTLTVVLVGIVLGSLAAAVIFDRTTRHALVFGAVQIAIAIAVLGVLMLPARLWHGLLDPVDLGTQMWIVVLILLGPAVLSGMSFPLAIRMVVRHAADAGPDVGRMSALNTAGGIGGALGTGFLLLPKLGLGAAVFANTAVSLFVGLTAWLVLDRTTARPLRFAMSGLCIATWVAIGLGSGTRLPEDFLARQSTLVDHREGLSAIVSVVRDGADLCLEIDRLWQGTARKSPQVVAAHVPSLLHERPRDVLVIGLGPGQTASRFLMHDIERLDCVDIERELLPMIRDHFDSAWMDDPRVRFIIDDGRSHLAHAEVSYDLISIEVGQVFRPGVASFYTRECYEQARRRLNPGGLLCQFVPVSFFSPAEFRTIVRTFIDVFPQAVMWTNRSEFLLIGSCDDDIRMSSQRLARIVTDPELHADLDFSYWGGPAHALNRPEILMGGFIAGSASLAALAGDAAAYHDDRPFLEYTTADRERLNERFEIATVKMVRAHLDPIDQILAEEPARTPWAFDRTDVIRQRNLGDVIASVWRMPAEQMLAAGRVSEAVARLREAVRWNPDDFEAHLMLGVQFTDVDPGTAVTHLRHAIRINPSYAVAHYNLANVLRAQGRANAAADSYRRALEFQPRFADAHNNLATVYQSQRKWVDAMRHYREAVKVEPELTAAHHNLANLLSARGAAEEAIEHYRQVLLVKPDAPKVLSRLAAALIAAGNREPAEAVHLAEKAARLTQHRDPSILDTLAGAYAAAGRLQDAATTTEKAMGLTRNSKEISGLRDRLQHYRSESGP